MKTNKQSGPDENLQLSLLLSTSSNASRVTLLALCVERVVNLVK